MKTSCFLLIFSILKFTSGQNTTFNPTHHPGILCNRDCNGSARKICYFSMTLEHYHALGPACGNCGTGSNSDCFRNQCIVGDGSPRMLMSINRQHPGPALHVCQNDLVVVDVKNMMGGTSTTIHWHGIHMRETPYFDGVPYVTQCPIDFANTFRYSFWASEAGTQWYHSHAGHHKTNGIYGALVVRRNTAQDPNKVLYDEDLPEHVIIISDNMQYVSEMYDPGLRQDPRGIAADNIVINGRGMRRGNVTRSGFATIHSPLEVFKVEKGKRYRFRIINAMSHVCPTSIEIQGHSLTVIASDSFDLRPKTVERLISNAGERYDFVVDASQCGGNFWIRVAGVGVCDIANPLEQYAILTYDQTTPINDIAFEYDIVPQRTDQLNNQQRTLNHPQTVCGPNDLINLCVTDMESYDIGTGIVDVEPTLEFTLGFKQNRINTSDSSYFFKGSNYEHFMSLSSATTTVASINGISYMSPPISLQTQFDDISTSGIVFCDKGTIPSSCTKKEYCPCVHRIKIPLGAIVQVILVDLAETPGIVPHPFHIHGHPLYVTEIGQNFNDSMTAQKAEELLRARRAARSSISGNHFYPLKDTMSVPSGGFTVVRFRADNPGFWAVHCHYEWHMLTGMMAILQVGETHEMVPPPIDFPKCGNYRRNSNVATLNGQWIAMDANSVLPANCHIGGHERNAINGTVTFVGRRNFESKTVIGRVKIDMKKIYVPRDNTEASFSDYEIFCGGRIEWVSKETDISTLVPAGVDVNGVSTYVCKAKYMDAVFLVQIITGSYNPVTKVCTTATSIKVMLHSDNFTLMRSI